MMSCRACFLAVQPAIMKPINKMMAEMNLGFPASQETLGNH